MNQQKNIADSQFDFFVNTSFFYSQHNVWVLKTDYPFILRLYKSNLFLVGQHENFEDFLC